MASISGDQKTEDRISNLPTNLITHIFSFLPTKDVVRTSTLSTYWNQQWTLISHLDFDDNDFLLRLRKRGKRGSRTRSMFVNFIYRVLLFLKLKHLDLFRLRSDEYYDGWHVDAWVSTVLSRNVQQLDLDVPMRQQFLPCSLFTSNTLVVLKLGAHLVLRVPATISLKSLKTLHLKSVEFLDDDSLSRFISSCPALEDLKMHGSMGGNINVINISSLGLKRLALLYSDDFDDDEISTYEIVINTPNLQYFEHEDDTIPDRYSIKSLRYLLRADIKLGYNPYPYISENANTMMNLFVGISYVQFLCLSSRSIEVYNKINCKLPEFPHLTYLKINASNLLTNFLESSCHLQTLVLEGDIVCENTSTRIVDNWCPPTKVPSCMLFHLKVIEVGNFRGMDEELHIISYFLNKSEVLEELRIRCSCVLNKEDVIKKLMTLPRASKFCKIVPT